MPWRKPGLWGLSPSQRRMRTGSPSGCCPASGLGGEERAAPILSILTWAAPSRLPSVRQCPGLVGLRRVEPTHVFQLQAASRPLCLSPDSRSSSQATPPSHLCCRHHLPAAAELAPSMALRLAWGRWQGMRGSCSAGQGPGFWLDLLRPAGPVQALILITTWDLLEMGKLGWPSEWASEVSSPKQAEFREVLYVPSGSCHPPLFSSFLEHLIQNLTGLPAGSHLCILTPLACLVFMGDGYPFPLAQPNLFYFAPSHLLALTHCRIFLGTPLPEQVNGHLLMLLADILGPSKDTFSVLDVGRPASKSLAFFHDHRQISSKFSCP